MRLDDLTGEERIILGALARLMIRADGKFTEAEEEAVNRIGDRLGGHGLFWRAVSDSAQRYPDEAAVRGVVASVSRPEVRALITATLREIADDGEVTRSESSLLDWLARAWA